MSHEIGPHGPNYGSVQESRQKSRYIRRITAIGLMLNLLLSTVKFLAGVLGHSQALVADAVHSLSDTITDVAVMIGSLFWSQPPDQDHPYGHQKIETMVSLAIGVALAVTAAALLHRAFYGLQNKSKEHVEMIAALAAAVSIVTKEILYRWTWAAGNKIGSSALIANAWHHRSDAFSSAPALVAVLIAGFFPAWNMVDLVGAIIVSLFLLYGAFTIIAPAFQEITEKGADPKTIAELTEISMSEPGVMDVHDMRSRFVSGKMIIDMHIVLEGEMPLHCAHTISDKVRERVMKRNDVLDVVVHIEPDNTP